ncbi:MAG: hypothetical protein K2P51_04220 [Rhabdochlamydiaceae bacterium]|nr:hypothetical protein [Rhabdochlamydiaceae bacterium]
MAATSSAGSSSPLFSHSSQTNWTYFSDTNDFGVVIQKLLFAQWNGELPNVHFQSNMVEVAQEEGFELLFVKEGIMPRDLWIKVSGDEFALPSKSPSIPLAVRINESLSFLTSNKAAFRTHHIFFDTCLGIVYEQLKRIQRRFPLSESIAHLPFYMEGGNCFSVTNVHGVRKLLIGKDSFSIAFLHQCLDGLPLFGEISVQEDAFLSPDKVQKIADKMHAQGFLDHFRGYVSGSQITNLVDQVRFENKGSLIQASFFQKKAIESGVHCPLKLPLEEWEEIKQDVHDYYQFRQRIKTQLVKKLLSETASPLDLLIVPQAGYHLDTFMRPGPRGSLFLQDYQTTFDFLKEIEKEHEKLELTALDCEILNRYLATAKQLSDELGALFFKIRDKLEAGGFTVIPTPGVFFDVSPNDILTIQEECKTCPKFNVNFLNSITGWSQKKKHYYWIASGAKVQDRLGWVLMDAFEKFLLQYIPTLKVHFIGYDPENPEDFSEAMDLWNHPEAMAGPHCFSLELQAASHDEVPDCPS